MRSGLVQAQSDVAYAPLLAGPSCCRRRGPSVLVGAEIDRGHAGRQGPGKAPFVVGPEDMVIGPARVEKAHHDGRARDGLLVGPLDNPRDCASLRGGRCRFRGGRLRAPRPRLLPSLDGADAKGGGAQTRDEEEGRTNDHTLTRERADRARHVNLQETLDAGRNGASVQEWERPGQRAAARAGAAPGSRARSRSKRAQETGRPRGPPRPRRRAARDRKRADQSARKTSSGTAQRPVISIMASSSASGDEPPASWFPPRGARRRPPRPAWPRWRRARPGLELPGVDQARISCSAEPWKNRARKSESKLPVASCRETEGR